MPSSSTRVACRSTRSSSTCWSSCRDARASSLGQTASSTASRTRCSAAGAVWLHRVVHPTDDRGHGESADDRVPTCSLRSIAATSTRRSPHVSTRRRIRFMGKQEMWEYALGRLARVDARCVPGRRVARPIARRSEALHRHPGGRRTARAVPRRRTQGRPGRAAAVRRRRVRRGQGRRADHPDRHRRLGTGDAAPRQDDPPAQGVRGHR